MPLKFSTDISGIPKHYKLSIKIDANTMTNILENINSSNIEEETQQMIIGKALESNVVIASQKTESDAK